MEFERHAQAQIVDDKSIRELHISYGEVKTRICLHCKLSNSTGFYNDRVVAHVGICAS